MQPKAIGPPVLIVSAHCTRWVRKGAFAVFTCGSLHIEFAFLTVRDGFLKNVVKREKPGIAKLHRLNHKKNRYFL
jgi:hypothetical protein